VAVQRPDPATLRTRRRAAVTLVAIALIAGTALVMGWTGSEAEVATRDADGPTTTLEWSTTTTTAPDPADGRSDDEGGATGDDGTATDEPTEDEAGSDEGDAGGDADAGRGGPLEPTEGSLSPTGTYTAAPGAGPAVGSGPLRTYVVEVEDGIGIDPGALATEVDRVLGDPRGWTADGAVSLQRVAPDQQPSFRVVLATPQTTDGLCAPLRTNGIFSCYMDGRAVLNLYRWTDGAAASGLDLPEYREYVINHEVGHALGHGHVGCPGAGLPAPVMMQQTKGIGACAPNPWPRP
jgi:hypothetical protein